MKKNFRRCDKVLLIMMILYSLLGLLMIFSSSSVFSVLREHRSPYAYFFRQVIFVSVSYIVGLFLIMHIPVYKYDKYINSSIVIMIILLIGLIVKGTIVNGSKSWYDLGLFKFQPSEFCKTLYILYIANFYYRYQKSNKEKSKYYFIRPLIVCVLFTLPILLQPDLGTAVILCGICVMVMIFVPLDKENRKKVYRLFGVGLLAVILLFTFGKEKFLTDRQISRLTYKEACKRYTERTGYQVCNSLIAVNNGGLFGAGLGNSTQKYMYLPAAHTDFAFAIVIEELGALISSLILIGYILILYRIYKIAKASENLKNSIIAFGTFSYMILHIFINLFGILGLIPLTGVPLPFVSYGGSFNVNLLVLLFLVERVAIENNNIKLKREIENI